VVVPCLCVTALLSSWGGVVLFNPGIGHKALAASWRPTLDLLKAAPRPLPVLWTAHSEEDMERDRKALEAWAPRWLTPPEANPFASRMRVMDPLEPGHVVTTNAFAGVFVLAS
jgi:hypothetical protein